MGHKLLDHAVDRGCGHHHPYGAGRCKLRDKIGERRRSGRSFVRQLFYIGGVQVEYHARLAALTEAANHIGAHAAEADHSELHKFPWYRGEAPSQIKTPKPRLRLRGSPPTNTMSCDATSS